MLEHGGHAEARTRGRRKSVWRQRKRRKGVESRKRARGGARRANGGNEAASRGARVNRMANGLFDRVNTRVTLEHDGVPFFPWRPRRFVYHSRIITWNKSWRRGARRLVG